MRLILPGAFRIYQESTIKGVGEHAQAFETTESESLINSLRIDKINTIQTQTIKFRLGGF